MMKFNEDSDIFNKDSAFNKYYNEKKVANKITTYACACGSNIRVASKYRHILSRKHKNFIKTSKTIS